MALTRKFLTAMNIEEAQADQIIEEHTSTIARITEELEGYKADAEKLAATEKKLVDVQKELDDLRNDTTGEDEYKTKYENLQQEFENYKAGIKNKEIKDSKAKAFRELLRESNISEKRFDAIIKLSDEAIDKLEFEEDGSVKDKESVIKAITEDWSEYVQSKETKGAEVSNPPANNGGNDTKISRAKAIAQKYHDDLYGKTKED